MGGTAGMTTFPRHSHLRGNDEGGARESSRLLVQEERLMMGGTQELQYFPVIPAQAGIQ